MYVSMQVSSCLLLHWMNVVYCDCHDEFTMMGCILAGPKLPATNPNSCQLMLHNSHYSPMSRVRAVFLPSRLTAVNAGSLLPQPCVGRPAGSTEDQSVYGYKSSTNVQQSEADLLERSVINTLFPCGGMTAWNIIRITVNEFCML